MNGIQLSTRTAEIRNLALFCILRPATIAHISTALKLDLLENKLKA